jgi:hypothetical protein
MMGKNSLYSWLTTISIILAPFNLFFRWLENKAYLNGLFSDYLLAKIWLAEIPIIIVLILWTIELIRKKSINFSKNKIFILLISFIFVRQFFSENPLLSIISFLRLFEIILFGLFLKEKVSELNKKLINISLIFILFFQIFLANTQFFLQRSVFNYSVFGETQLTSSINIAKLNFKQGLLVAPYGSMAHPNILAGFLLIISILLLKKIKNNYFCWIVIALASWTIFLTQSYSAIAGMIIFLTFQNYKVLKEKLSYKLFFTSAILIPISLFLADQQQELISIKRRVFLNNQAILIWLKNIFIGTGLNNFLYHLETKSSPELVRFVQPAHNIFLLMIAELGLLGTSLIIKSRNWIKENIPLEILFILLPIISLDHYLLTQWIGGWLIMVLLFL